MKRKILIAIYVALIVMTIKLMYNIVTNNMIIKAYENGKYLESRAKALTYFNFPQGYVAHYNYGNILYKNANYKKAIEEYEKALSKKMSKNKECSVRINYALAICKTVELNESEQESIKNAIKTYESAIEILQESRLENGKNCPKAEQLTKDIQAEIDRLKNLRQEDKKDNEANKDENQKKEEIETIERKIQNIKQEATKEQREAEQLYKDFTKSTQRIEKNW